MSNSRKTEKKGEGNKYTNRRKVAVRERTEESGKQSITIFFLMFYCMKGLMASA